MCVPSIALCQRHVKPIRYSKRPRLGSKKSHSSSLLFQPHHQKPKVTASICDASWANHSGELGISQRKKPVTEDITGVFADTRLHPCTCDPAVGRTAGRCDHCCWIHTCNSRVNNQAAPNSLASALRPPTSVPTEMLAVSSENRNDATDAETLRQSICLLSSQCRFFCLFVLNHQKEPPPTRLTSQPPPSDAGWRVGAVPGG